MVAGFEQRPWTPTVRKGPIAAETATPGPAAVTLPTLIGKTPIALSYFPKRWFSLFLCFYFKGTKVPDSRKHAAPAFTFGQKHRQTVHSLGEGPAKYNITGLGNKGKDTPPAASLQSRHKESSKFSTPAPGEYDVQKATKAINQSTPKYTFGQKLTSEKCNSTPGKFQPHQQFGRGTMFGVWLFGGRC